MKTAKKQDFPVGWNEKKVRAVIAHYDGQTEDEAAAEINSAPEAPGETWMCVPVELVGAISRLIKNHAQKPSSARSRNHKKRAPQSKA